MKITRNNKLTDQRFEDDQGNLHYGAEGAEILQKQFEKLGDPNLYYFGTTHETNTHIKAHTKIHTHIQIWICIVDYYKVTT